MKRSFAAVLCWILLPGLALALITRFDIAIDRIPWMSNLTEAQAKLKHPGQMDAGSSNEWRLVYGDHFYGNRAVVSYYFAAGKLNETHFHFVDGDLRGVFRSIVETLQHRFNSRGKATASNRSHGQLRRKILRYRWLRDDMTTTLTYRWLETNLAERRDQAINLLLTRLK